MIIPYVFNVLLLYAIVLCFMTLNLLLFSVVKFILLFLYFYCTIISEFHNMVAFNVFRGYRNFKILVSKGISKKFDI